MLLNCIIVDYFILFYRDYYLALFLLYSLSFHFIFLLVLLSSFKFYLILCCICCFISYLSYCIYYHFILSCIPRNPLSQKCGEKTNSFILLFHQTYMKTRFNFLRRHVLNFTKQVFWFKLLSVFYDILQSTRCLWNTVAVSFLAKCIAGCFELGKKIRPGLLQKHCALCDGVLVCILFSRSLVLLIFNFFSRLLFQLVYREFSNYHFITYIKNPARLLGWSFLQKQLTTECPLLFLQISPSQIFDGVFNRPLRWCI